MGFILSKNKSPSNEAEAQPSTGSEDESVPKDAKNVTDDGCVENGTRPEWTRQDRGDDLHPRDTAPCGSPESFVGLRRACYYHTMPLHYTDTRYAEGGYSCTAVLGTIMGNEALQPMVKSGCWRRTR